MMNAPQIGEYYYHCNHDPKKGINDHAYVIESIAIDTETDNAVVVYRPLYKSNFLIEKQAHLFTRPLEVFLGTKLINGKEVPRFTKITDQKLIDDFQQFKF